MLREFSAGGVVLRRAKEAWWIAVVELPKNPPDASSAPGRAVTRPTPVLTLPKGLIDPGEKPPETALREVREETGLNADLIVKLSDVKYFYVRSWADRARVFKIVSFYLMRYRSGRIDDIDPAMRIEVAQAKWIRLEEAPKLLAYKGEKDMARRAIEYLAANPDL
ncbi:MAG TPA: NUDIX domain-containing protein [Candidatus Aquilonibacter sp.]|nr:NUDIX domain-containing protein [Candidatus Aquilonibacter sp.]